jgi:hypothetical protein
MNGQSATPHLFNPDTAIKAARGFHGAACLLEKAHQSNMAQLSAHPSTDIYSPFEDTTPGAVVLESLALELVLKVRLYRAGIWGRKTKTHKHRDLFALLPATDKCDTEQRYQAYRHPAMRATLEEVLNFSSDIFETWRYPHEHSHVVVSTGEMQRAFRALADGL